MSHNVRCERARTKRSRCQCRCLGAQHGLAKREEDFVPGERPISIEMGGEIAAFLKRIEGRSFKPGYGVCFHGPEIVGWQGYPHDGGLADAQGNKWWIYVVCDECHYQASFWKVERRLDMIAAKEVPV